MSTSVELRQERARTVESMRAITERAETENRNLDATELESYNRGEGEFRALSDRIERAELLERADAEAGSSISGAGGAGGSAVTDEQRSQQRRGAFLTLVRRGLTALTPEQRALVENTAGEILVPADLESDIYRELPDAATIRPLTTPRTTTSNRVRRRSLGEVAVGWGKLETGTDLTDSMPTTPTEDYIYVEDLYGLAKIGEDELDDTDVNLEALLRDSFGRAIADAEDLGFIKGTGHANQQPQGIFTAGTGITARTSSGTTFITTAGNAPGVLIDDLKALSYDVKSQYAKNGAYLMASTTELKISTTKDGNGQYLWQPSVQAGRPNTFNGYALYRQDDIDAIAVAKSIAAFGDVASGYRVLDRQGMTLQRLVELYAEDGLIGFKVRFRVGGGVVRPKAFQILKTAAS